MTNLIFSSIIIGLSIAAPVGPIGVLCIRRTLAEGGAKGLASGLGAATADGIYGFIAAFGLTALSTFLLDNVILLRIIGGGFLLYLGVRTVLVVPKPEQSETSPSIGLVAAYTSTFFLTITNPMTILAFLGIFAGLGAEAVAEDKTAALVMVIGVFFGSAVWWMMLSGSVSILRERVTPQIMSWINRLSGIIIIVFSLKILWHVVAA